MKKAIQQSVTFAASPKEVFALYTDSRKHTAATGVKALVSAKVGAKFTAFDGGLRGVNLHVVPQRQIVQRWRSTHWKKDDPDSILIIDFATAPQGCRVSLTHVNVPDHDYEDVSKGWPAYYWKPWKEYLKARAKK